MMHFNGRDEVPSIEEYVKNIKSSCGLLWQVGIWINLRDDASKWWNEVKYDEIFELSDKEYENLFLDKWPCSNIKDK
jgi:hypothetical protein